MKRRSPLIAASVLLVLAGCSDGSGTDSVSSSGPGVAHLPADGPPSLGAGPTGALAVQNAKWNTKEDPGENPAVLLRKDGTIVEVANLPSSQPLTAIAIAATSDSFVVTGVTCPSETSSEEGGCSDGVPEAFLLDAEAKWHPIARPPEQALNGPAALEGTTRGRFVTGGGWLLTYDAGEDKWTSEPVGPTAVVGGCDFGDTWTIVGSNPPVSDSPDPAESVADLALVDSSGAKVPLPETDSSGGEIACDTESGQIAFVSSSGPSYGYGTEVGLVQLPSLPADYEFGKGLYIDRGTINVPVYQLDVPPLGSEERGEVSATNEIASIPIEAQGRWSVATATSGPPSWAFFATASSPGARYIAAGAGNGGDIRQAYQHIDVQEVNS